MTDAVARIASMQGFWWMFTVGVVGTLVFCRVARVLIDTESRRG